jgi:sulfur carrier protein
VLINGIDAAEFSGRTVKQILEAKSIATRGVAVAINGEVIRRADWETTVVDGSDALEVVTAVAGG